MIKHHNYIIKHDSYLPGLGGVFPTFQSPFSYGYTVSALHSISVINGGFSCDMALSNSDLHWSQKYFKFRSTFEITPYLLKVPSTNRNTILLISYPFKLEL